MGALKTLVIVLGVMVVLAMGLLGWGFYHKANNPDFKLFSSSTETPVPPSAPVVAPVASHATAFGEISLAAPKGCVIADARIEGNALLVHVRPDAAWLGQLGAVSWPDCDRVVVIDMATGQTRGSVSLATAP